jgi:hypothetical protein
MNLAVGRTQCAPMQNKSGGAVAFGDVVVFDAATSIAFTTTTTGGYYAGPVGVVLDYNGIANNAFGMIAFSGYVPRVNLSSAASLGDLFKCHTVAKQAVRHTAPMVQGDFGAVLETGSTPRAVLFGMPNPVAGSGGDPWTELAKTADQDVTDSAALTNDSDLAITVTADTYHFLMYLLYSGNTTAGDFKFDFLPSTGNMSGWYSYIGSDTTADAINVSTGIRLSAAATITAIAAGTDASHTVRQLKIEAMLRFSAGATFNLRFAQNAATGATAARMKKGSILRYRKLPVA